MIWTTMQSFSFIPTPPIKASEMVFNSFRHFTTNQSERCQQKDVWKESFKEHLRKWFVKISAVRDQ